MGRMINFFVCGLVLAAHPLANAGENDGRVKKKLLLAHMMPWFQSKATHGAWGWHWTMGKTNPDRVIDGMPDLASHFHPLIGPYDSGDDDLISCQLLTMKLAGIDGVLIDWYGIDDLWDYKSIHQNTLKIIQKASLVGLKFGIVYEDQTIKHLIDQGKLPVADSVQAGQRTLRWMAENWFVKPNYVRVDDKPVILVFGPTTYSADEWQAVCAGARVPLASFTLSDRKQGSLGGFDWPMPRGGAAGCETEREAFRSRSRSWSTRIDAAYPRFEDYYAEAEVHASWGQVPDDGGKRFQNLLEEGIQSAAPIIQLITWNDWGEGTQIEPSVEFGYRDLETVQKAKRKLSPRFLYQATDLRLPIRLYELRKRVAKQKGLSRICDQAEARLVAGETAKASSLLDQIEKTLNYEDLLHDSFDIAKH